jgi:hypothetical protein
MLSTFKGANGEWRVVMRTMDLSRVNFLRVLTFFILMSSLCSGCGSYAGADVDAVSKAGGRFITDQYPFGSADQVSFDPTPSFDDTAFAKVFPSLQRLNVYALYLGNTAVTNKSLPLISELRSLKYLSLAAAEFAPNDLILLSRLRLQEIDLMHASTSRVKDGYEELRRKMSKTEINVYENNQHRTQW